MEPMTILLIALVALSLVLQFVFRPKRSTDDSSKAALLQLQESVRRIESGLKEDFRISREEAAKTGRENRDELNISIRDFKNELTELREKLSKDLTDFSAKNAELLEKIRKQVDQELKTFMDQDRKSTRLNSSH